MKQDWPEFIIARVGWWVYRSLLYYAVHFLKCLQIHNIESLERKEIILDLFYRIYAK